MQVIDLQTGIRIQDSTPKGKTLGSRAYRVPAKCRERLETSVTLKSLPNTDSLVCICNKTKYQLKSAMLDPIMDYFTFPQIYYA